MAFKPNYQKPAGRTRIDFAASLSVYEDTKRNKKTSEERKKDTEKRSEIQGRIRELKKLGFSEKEALIRLNTEFPNSSFSGFFEGWIKNAFKDKRQTPFRGAIKNDVEESR